MPSGHGDSSRVAIVGASSLLGKELKQVLEDRNFPTDDIVLLDEGVMAGTLTEAAGEATFLRALEEDSFEGARFAFFAGSAQDAARNRRTAEVAGATVIDLSGGLAGMDRVRAWIPSLSFVLPPPGGANGGASGAVAYASPSAPAIIACTVAGALARFQPARVAMLLFPPVSERDQEGIEELESQTTSLLSFHSIAQPVFDAQVAFNLLAGYGPESKISLADVRSRIAREVAGYLGGRTAIPAIQLVQAPVFYGYAFAAYAEFAAPVSPGALEPAFANLGVKIAAAGETPPSNVSAAGENEIQLARIDADPNVANGVWLWGAVDNLRLAATNAVRIAEELVARPLN